LFASGVLALNEKLGPILWQFPANFAYDAERFETFFALLPRDTKSAVALARRLKIEMPIAEKMYSVLYEGRKPQDAIGDLLERKLKEE